MAFKKSANMTMVMGDLVLTEAEVGPVMWSLQESGIDITALHNHVLDESPRVGEILSELRRRKLNGELDGRESELAAARELIGVA